MHVRQLKEDKAKYKGRAAELERRLDNSNKVLRQKQEVIDDLETTLCESKEAITLLEVSCGIFFNEFDSFCP